MEFEESAFCILTWTTPRALLASCIQVTATGTQAESHDGKREFSVAFRLANLRLRDMKAVLMCA